MQYELMRYIARAAHGCVTIVGDPDQSSTSRLFTTLSDLVSLENIVYGWRSAEIENLSKMRRGAYSLALLLLFHSY